MADALLKRGEGELPGVANEDDPARDPDDVLGLRTGLEMSPGDAHIGERVRAGDPDGVGLAALVEEPLPRGQADLHLLTDVGRLRRFGHRCSLCVHDMPQITPGLGEEAAVMIHDVQVRPLPVVEAGLVEFEDARPGERGEDG